ncbi:MAG: magnesium chelatase subunit H [Chlorobium sp.]|nr:magnesium chelatase subunit H [Chlorobium sp.]MCF8271645.1 magnesium chelatase subunit H [Chlorobium sp.]MCF8288017.1 magnesium chelatase subunit H [Chlorobium sp.]MCF8291580.1 magnesium chelatase subunit H [Chlorobium sp.]MCF8385716.1 magnesium chelatase subunit H [Chlorobium sp.]
MRFVFLTMEATNNSALKSAAGELNHKYDTKLEVSIFNLGLQHDKSQWEKLEHAFRSADFIFGSMLFSEEIVRPLERLLNQVSCPICIITSNPALLTRTRLGKFSLRKSDAETEKEPGLFRQWTAKLRPKHSHGESQRQLALARNVGKIMKYIPGKARDIHTFIASHQFWLNGSQENMERFLSLIADRYVPAWKGKLPQADAIFYPDTGLFHPGAAEPFQNAKAFGDWQQKNRPELTKGPVAILAMRSTVLSRNMMHLEHLVRDLESQGISTCIAYSGGLDFRPALDRFFDPEKPGTLKPGLLLNATGFSLVGGPAENRAAEAIAALKKIDTPCYNLIPLSFQPIEQWKQNGLGLTPLQTALSVAVPELDGTIEPHVYAGTGNDRTIPLEREIFNITRRIDRFLRLRAKPVAEKKIAIVLFNFPPNLGNAGTAAYLSVFESLMRLLGVMQKAGYRIDMPASIEELKERLLEGNRLVYGTDGNVETNLSTEEYRKLFPACSAIEPFWGDAPGNILTDRNGFHILGCSFGNVFIGQQPSFGYERDPMRLLMAKDAAPNHAFAAFYTWLEHCFDADAVLHFGTHGALEFMPGKQAGLSAECWPKRLIGNLPNYYCYCVNNPSEGAIAKRRGFATLVSYLSPPLEHAGLYKGLRKLKDLLAAAQQHPQKELFDEIHSLAAELSIDTGCAPEETESYLSLLGAELYLIEERMIPMGLHIMGDAPAAESLVDHLALLAAHSRPELDNRSLPELICKAKNIDYHDLLEQTGKDRNALREWQDILALCRESIRLFTGHLSPEHTRTVPDVRTMLEGSFPVRVSEADNYLIRKAGLKSGDMQKFWPFLNRVLGNLAENNELQAVLHALDGAYIPPSPGNDLVRNPDIVPTGRNIHSLDPYSIPSAFARQAGIASAGELLDQYRKEHGCEPESIAMVLWGTDNLKSDGEGIAQALALLGAKPKTDELGKTSDVELVPLADLGRPRIDVVITISSIFRDLLAPQVKLLDKAARMAAAADEPLELNYIRKHVLQEMQEKNISFSEASNRVFSNAPGSYGANVNHLVESSTWEEEQQLADAFVSRKSFAATESGEWQECPEALRSALSHVTVTFQNIDSYEIGISDIDHYYEYLGGVSKTIEHLSGSKPDILVGDINGFGTKQRITPLEKMVALETRTKLLNPKWYEAMLEHGYEGVREIESHLSNTYGWSATASAVGDWTYQQFNETFLQDPAMLERLTGLNMHAVSAMTRRLLEANARGFWNTDEKTIAELRQLYEDLDSRIEGIDGAQD